MKFLFYLMQDDCRVNIYYFNESDNFRMPFVSQWDNYTELHFVQAGTPPYFVLPVGAWLDNHFTGWWTERWKPTDSPPQSPDLTACDIFLWGWVKEKVRQSKPSTLGELQQQIWDTSATIPFSVLLGNCGIFVFQLQMCVQNAGAYVEIWH